MESAVSRFPAGLPLLAYALLGLGTYATIHRHTAWPATPRTPWIVASALIFAAAATFVYIERRRSRPSSGWGLAGMALSALALIGLEPDTAYDATPILAMGVLGARLSPALWPYLAVPYAAVGAYVLQPTPTLSGYLSNLLGLLAALVLGRYVTSRREQQAEQARLFAELRTTHEALQAAHRQLLAQAAQAEELAALRERERLARELHDTLGHALSTVTVQLEAARRVARRAPERSDEMLAEIQALSRQAMADLRNNLAALRDTRVDEPPGVALRRLAHATAARAGWALSVDLQPIPLPPKAASALLKVAAEALANAERHADAQNVTLQLMGSTEAVTLIVADDGHGFDPSQPKPGHYGLQGMCERLAPLGGHLAIESSPGAGTRVTAHLGLDEAQSGGNHRLACQEDGR